MRTSASGHTAVQMRLRTERTDGTASWGKLITACRLGISEVKESQYSSKCDPELTLPQTSGVLIRNAGGAVYPRTT